MNPPTQPPPLPSHRAPRRRLARDLIGLSLAGAGSVGLLGALYVASPTAVVFLVGLLLIGAGTAVLCFEPALPQRVRAAIGYGLLIAGLTVVTAVAYALNPWTLLFEGLLTVAVWLMSSEGE
ncbi:MULTISPECIES: hypothetical protein [unclassified Streptomyces]|uniref:hypothetical protein n=1 Tax=unclassified Streptomyces TaxID=2593676 RepID=UPI00331BEB9B